MTKNNYILGIFFTLLMSVQLFSQDRLESRKKMKALKISYITNALNLTTKEAETFWPIYNKFDSKRHDLFNGKRNEIKKEIFKKGGIDHVSEEEAKKFMKEILAIETTYHIATISYHKELEKVLDYKKILKLQIAERDFTRRMFKRLRKEKKEK
jgi:hypothetical protein